MKFLRENIVMRFLWFAMALHILNICVDMPDPEPSNVPEDLSFNDMESVVEIILEEICGIDNAIAEQDEPDEPSDNNYIVKVTIDHFVPPSLNVSTPVILSNTHQLAFYKDNYSSQFHPEFTSPPPKA